MTDVCVKWSCDYCTYENWPSALTCTMCRAQRPMGSIITEEAHPVCSDFLICPDSSTRAHPVESSERSRKWSCEACTYQNWPRAIRCTQCQSLRSPCEEHNRRNRGDTWPQRRTCAHQNLPRTPNCVVRDPPNSSEPVSHEAEVSAGAQSAEEETEEHPKKVKQMKNRMRRTDWLFLNACTGVVEGDLAAVEAYRSSGGDVARQLTSQEVRVLARPSAFDVGFTLVHLSIRFQRQDMMTVLLTEVPQRAVKCMPAMVCPELTEQICREIRASLHQRKGDFNCYFLSELVTFTLPADIEDLPPAVQEKLFDEVLDRDVQKELEDSAVINWSLEFGNRLHALWNRSAGDCLLDSVLQATWGIYDKDSVLRRTLHDSLHTCSHWFYTRWKEWESWYSQSFGLHFSLREEQWQNDWTSILNLASQPGASLEHTHVFVLSHILRRPIIVYGVKYYKSFRGEALGYTRFQGVYLPLLWEPSFCWKSPIALGYTRGHFSALVGMETDGYDNRGAGIDTDDDVTVTFLPLVDSERKLLQIHFLSEQEMGSEDQQERLLRHWLDCCVTDGGMLAALQKNSRRHTLVTHMMDQWLQGYRR